MTVHRRFPCNQMVFERCCKEEWANLPEDWCAKFVASYSERLEALIAAKGASTKYGALSMPFNAYVHVSSKKKN